MQSLPRSNTAAKIPAEIILEKIYPRSCRLEVAIERLLPSCDLYTDIDPATYIKLCSSTLVASEDDDLHIFSPDFTPSQALSAIAVLPGSRTLDWNDQAPLRSVLKAVPDEKFAVDLRLVRKRPPFYEFLSDIGFELLNERIGSGLLLRLLMYCAFFIPLENDCYLQITGTPIYNLNMIPIQKRGWSLSQRLRQVRRRKQKDRYRHRTRNKRRMKKRKRKIEGAGEPPNKRVRLEAAPATAPPSAIASQEDGPSPMEVGGQSLSTSQDSVCTELAPTGADRMIVDNQTNGMVSNKTNVSCRSTDDGQKSSDSNSESDAASVHSNSRRSLESRQQKRKVCMPYSLMTPEDKQAKRKKDKNRKKKMIRKLERRLESRSNLSCQQRKRIKGRLKRLRPHNRKKHKRKEATATAANREPSSQKKLLFINRTYTFYSATKQSFTSIYALQQLQPSVNGARKLVANIFEGRPIQDETKNTPPDSTPSAPSSVELPFVKEKPKRKAFKATATSSATFSTAPVPAQVSGPRSKSSLIFTCLATLAPNSREKTHYAGLLNHYCPLSHHLLSLAADAGGASTKLPQVAVPPSSRPASHCDAFKPTTVTATNTTEKSGAGNFVLVTQEKEEGCNVFVGPELLEDPLLPTGATAPVDAGPGVPSSEAAAGVVEYNQGRSGLVTHEQAAAGGNVPTSGTAAGGAEDHHQPTLLTHQPPPPPPPLKETIAQLVSQGKVSYRQVCAFVKAVLRHLVPMELWGSTQNRQLFFKHVEKFVGLGRFETINVQDLVQGYKLSSCEWLKLPSPSGRGKPHPPSFLLAKKFLHWLMNEVVVRTIKAHFYVTEHSAYRNQVFYYRKELWACVEKLAIKERTGSLLSQISVCEMQWACHEGKTLGGSKLRFLPKLTGVRPIINLRSRVMTINNEQLNSVNYQLNGAFHILNMEMKRRPRLVGSSCFGRDEVHKKLREFATQQARVDPQREGPLLFVNTDIATCYDSILPDKLIDILTKEVLSQESYLLRRYSKICLTTRGVKKRFIKTAVTRAESNEPFYEFAFNSSTQDSNCILTDQIKYPVVKRDALEDVLKKHLFGNLVKLGFKYFRQAEGIPQGSRISTMLCGFYYADMEKKCLPRVDPRTGLLLRFIDDFLLITREPEVAKEFLATLEQGVPEYNCHINAGKTATNFDQLPDGSLKVNKKEWIEWCGFLINTSTLNVKIDLSRYASTEISSCITIRVGSNPILSLCRFIKKATQLRCLPLFLDGQLLSQKTVASNIYESFVIVAMKFIVFIRSVPGWYPTNRAMEKSAKRKQAVLYFRLIMDSIYWFVRQAKNICIKASGVFDLPAVVSWWLGCSAYRRVLEKHEPARMKVLIKLLSSRMTAAANTMPLQWVKLSHRTIVKANTVDNIPL